ncbi:MAG: transglycosylase domain-containing protein [Tidjanibacter sp.]|nr:transglycosylase domain-containing protein [Tidjanibacter sp.]
MSMKKTYNKDPREVRITRWFWTLVLVPTALVLLIIFLTAAGTFGKLPSFEELENPQNNIATEIYSADGKMIGSFFIQNRSYVNYEDLSPALVAALVSTEDARYYSHSGIDFISLARVGIKTLALGNRDQGGGSTITQQLAKNLFPRDTTTYNSSVARASKLVLAKFKEWITAVKLEYNYTKEEIITMYLNTVFYGSNAYGIKSAAATFFGKEPKDLNIQEAAMLVGVVNAPTRYSPVRNPERAMARRNTVMARMRANKYISKQQLDSLSQTEIELHYTPISHNDGSATYFREMLRTVLNAPKPRKNQYQFEWDYEQELARWESNPLYGWCQKNTKADGTEYNIYRDGLKIYTTIDSRLQRYAEEAIAYQMERTIQPAMDAQYRATRVLFQDIEQEEIDKIMYRAMRYTDRYIALKERGASEAEIDKEFRTRVKTQIFTYKGYVDTLISPRDSILHHKRIMRAAFMAVEPSSGHVKAYVGGPDFRYFKYDMVKQGKRQIGSTIKPFIYTFALDHMGFNPCTMVPNLPVTIETYSGEPWTPKEAGEVVYDGVMHPLRWGLARSRNNYSAWIMKQAKQPEAVADFLHNMGIHSYIYPAYALCLGTAEVSLFELVGAYSTFVNRGVFTEPIFVTRIEDRQGNLLASFSTTSNVAISEQTAHTMLGMLQNVVRAGTAGRLGWQFNMSDVEVGGKTGTSQENRDAWFMGVLPNLVAGTWVGAEDQSVHLASGGEGSVMALPVFGEFMKRVYADQTLNVKREDKFHVPLGATVYDCPDDVEPSVEAVEEDEFFQ